MKIPLDVLLSLPREWISVRLNGAIVADWSVLTQDDDYEVRVRLLGGKGGFGSLLRSFGSQFYKSTNQEMCRDLSGRRLKNAKDEQRVRKYLALVKERRKRQKLRQEARLKRLKHVPKHTLNDEEYNKTKQYILERTESAVEEGLKRVKAPGDSAANAAAATVHNESNGAGTNGNRVEKVRGSMWLGLDDFEEEDDSEHEATA